MTPRGRLSEDELAARAARGDGKAFEALFERLQDPLYRYALSILGRPEEARDALRAALLEARSTLGAEGREIAVRPWLHRIVRAESVARLRGREPLAAIEDAVEAAAEAAGSVGEERARLEQLVAGLRELPERQRSALVLRELSGLDYEELGQALDVSPNAARQTVFKARLSLQGDVEGRTAHCDEVRAAISKDDGLFRKRRSIEAHLERCAVCSQFADQIERRPRDLEALFPPLPAGVAAAILADVTAAGGEAPERDYAGEADEKEAVAAGAAAGGAAAAAGARAARERPAREPRRRRGALVPVLLFALLVAGAVGLALLAGGDDDDGDGAPAGEVADDRGRSGGGTEDHERDTARQRAEEREREQAREREEARERLREEDRARQREEERDRQREEERARDREEEQERQREQDRAREREEEQARQREEERARQRDEERERQREEDRARRRDEDRERAKPRSRDEDCVRRAGTRRRTSSVEPQGQALAPAQAGYSGRAGSIETTVGDRAPATEPAATRNDCPEGTTATPRTGVDLGLLAAAAFVLLATGLALRRTIARAPLR
jgi:RNA polymerase sigma factor (sigma-70 family)